MARNRASRVSLGALALSSVAVGAVGGVVSEVISATPAFAGCFGGPNWYAGLWNTDSTPGYGVSAGIETWNPPDGRMPGTDSDDFSDQAVHVVPSPGHDGLEVGWYVGWGGGSHVYSNNVHAYATKNGPGEVDGIVLGDNSWYSFVTWYSGNEQAWSVRDASGTEIWSLARATNFSGPGQPQAVGEVEDHGDGMQGNFKNLQFLTPFGNSFVWANWQQYITCADTDYSLTVNSPTQFSDIGHG